MSAVPSENGYLTLNYETSDLPPLEERLIKLDYIQTSGTQWIDTLFKVSEEDVKVEIEFTIMSANTNTSLWGSETQQTSKYCVIPYGSLPTFSFYCGSTGSLLSTTVSLYKKHKMIVHAKDGVLTVQVDDGEALTANYSGSIINWNKISLFGNNIMGTTQQLNSIRLHKWSLYQSNALKINFLPVLDLNSVACLLDTVTETLFYNSGSGTFTAGPPLNTYQQQIVIGNAKS